MRASLGRSLFIVLLVAAGCGDNKTTTDARDGAGDRMDGSASNDRADVGGDKPATGGNGGSTTGTGGAAGTGTGGDAGTGTGGNAGTGGGAGTGGSGDAAAGASGNDGGSDADGGGAAPTCNDGIKNSDETGVDCGGHCGKCAPGNTCLVNADCQFACRADKTCAACNVAADCTGPETECEHRSCTAGACGTTRETAGTVLTVQAAGDCKRRQCAADGTVATVNDDSDVPDDRNACTNDICTTGTPSHTMMPANSNCGGANHCNATGQCIGCTVAADCPGTDTACRTRTCTTGGVCGFSFAASGTALVDPTAGDCKGLRCDGNGNEQVYNVDADLPVDGNVCTTDECSSGTPSHRPVASGTTCGGSLVCDGASKCVECLTASTCPGTDAECHTRSCMSGECGVANMAMGTLVAAQTPRDCKKNVCNGQGGVTTVNDDLDLPVDNNACTFDVCTAGTGSNPNVPSGNSCGTNTICDGQGACVTCLSPSSCPGTDTECHHRTCTSGVCGIANTAAATPLSTQTAGDCKRNQCDGNGGSVVVNDDNDKPVDGKSCTSDVCTNGVPSNPNLNSGTACGTNQVCNATGDCVGCNTAADCGTDSFCQTHTCSTAGVCGVTNKTAGTALPTGMQTAGDCKRVQCDGQGQQTTVNDDADKPVDGNACTQDVCSAGIPTNPPEASGTACSQDNGTKCNGSGSAPACVQCFVATDCPGTDTDCHHRTCTAGVCGISNDPDGKLVPTQPTGDCKKNICMGGAQVSVNDDGDLPVDGKACTNDLCNGGVASHTPVAKDTSCSEDGGTLCDGAGACVQCTATSQCTANNNDCQTFACTSGACVPTYAPNGTPLPAGAQTTGNCKQKVCNGSGGNGDIADDGDVPNDGNPCTTDTCNLGVPGHTSLTAGAACSQGNNTMCNGSATAPACVQCVADTNCGTNTVCKTFTCDTSAGTCSSSNTDDGTLVNNAGDHDCQKNVCMNGVVTMAADNADVPEDNNPCTTDTCNGGAPLNTNVSVGTTCGPSLMCDGYGLCVGCVTAANCPTGNDCQVRVCMPGGVCGFTPVATGTVVTDPTAGDCHHAECNGSGDIISVVDDNDKPAATSNACMAPTCTAGVPSQTPLAQGTACAQNNGTKCDGTGQCVECFSPSECPAGEDLECSPATCTDGFCGIKLTDIGTPVSTGQVSGDCQQKVCNGYGGVTSQPLNGDTPADANQCMTGGCNLGAQTQTPKSLGTACSENSGVRCDAVGACIPTFMAVRVGDGSAALSNAATPVFIEERSENDNTVFRTISVPSTNVTGTSPKSLTLSGLADSDGHLALSGDGHYVTLAGYNAAVGTAAVNGTATTGSTPPIVPRIAASINLAGTVDTTTTFGTAFNTDNVRSAVSNDGGQFWAGGNCSGGSCVRGVLYATKGASTSTLIESTSGSTRVCIIALGALYCDAAQGSRGIFTVGSGLPTSAATTSLLTGTADSNAQYYGLAVFDLTGGPNNTPDGVADTIYVADERAPATPAANGGGIKKWTLSGGTWSLADTFNNGLGTTGVRGLAAHTSSAGVVLIATTAIVSPSSPATNPNSNAILKYVDTGAAASTVNPTTLQAATAGANRVYRGVAVSPK